MEDEQKPREITPEEVERMKQLMADIAAFNESLKPLYAEIEKSLVELRTWEDIVKIMSFAGKDTFKISIKWDEIPYDITIKRKKV